MSSEGEESSPLQFFRSRHAKFLRRILETPNPPSSAAMDSSRMTIVLFCVAGLDLLEEKVEKEEIREWIWSCFSSRGFNGNPISLQGPGHIAMTYSALSLLLILDDPLERLETKSILAGLRELQLDNGSFLASIEDPQSDLRFLYCASAISYILRDWSGVNKEKAKAFILSTLRPEGAFAQNPNCEAHGGSTFCAVASLYLMGELDNALSPTQRKKLEQWVLRRVGKGFQGRPNKPSDSCYSFWLGATLSILGVEVDLKDCMDFTLSTQSEVVGGFAKWTNYSTDPLHTYFSLAGLSIIHKELKLQAMHPALNIPFSAYERVKKYHASR
eukprot:TRINITY_DN1797_c0_g1_i2.p1 TRINITY_DN1797_c0_g1~~TRINITY_DN1797_c0_g1_i2.p1  ORF type:complete len:329 (+),score=73.35 TRINITY_DN1797_c0_g1_i2:356-1342(+)